MKIASFKSVEDKGKYSLKQDYSYKGDDYWDWSIWTEGSPEDLDQIDYVVYNLHYTFTEPVKTVKTRENKFKLEASGWGTFTIYVRIVFKDESILNLEHELELYYPESNNPAPV